MAPPLSIRVGPYTYEVRWDEPRPRDAEDAPFRWDQRWGYSDNTHGVIYIHPEANPMLKRMILFHEVLHACAFAAGHMFEADLKEEDWVLMVTPMLLLVFRENPTLMEWLSEAL